MQHRVVALAALVAAFAPTAACSRSSEAESAAASAAVSASAVAGSGAPSGASSAAPSAAPPPPPAPPPLVIRDEGPFDVIDLHVDTPWKVHFKGRKLELVEGHATPAQLIEGSYAAIIYPIYIPDYADDNAPQIATADGIFDTIDKLAAAHEVLTPALVEGKLALVPDEKIAVFVTIEGAGAFAADITQIDRFIARGVRLIGPVHAHDNALATAATGRKKGGLTELGKQFATRVYEKGALVDVSHMSDAAFADLVPIASKFEAPIVATHSNARKLRNHKRNLTDEQLETIAATGGVAGLNLHSPFVAGGKPRMSHVVAQVLHMVKVAGVEHVAIGTDFDGGNPVHALEDASKLQALAKELVTAGLSEADVRKIFAKNALRVLLWGLDRSAR